MRGLFRYFTCLLFLVTGVAQAAPISFSQKVRPILSDKCFKCHGQDAQNNSSDFRADTFQEITKDLGGYAGVVPHDIEASKLIEVIFSEDADVMMPPPDSHLTLTVEEKEILKQWVKEGAHYEKHWAFKELSNSQ